MSDTSLRLNIDRIRDGDRIDYKPDDAALAAIGDRLDLLSLSRLEAHVILTKDGAKVRAAGRVRAALEQACAATGEPVAEAIDEPFELLFVPAPDGRTGDEEIELDEDEMDTVFHDGNVIELSDAIIDTLALSLDPYPRSAIADATLKAAGVMSEEEASPFAVLASLKSKLSE